MTDSTLAKKLLVKPGFRMMIFNAPPGYLAALGELPSGVKLLDKTAAPLDFAQIFVKTGQELEIVVPNILKALKKDGLLWICYPKGSKVMTDLNRDILWRAMGKFGVAGVAMVSIDSTWSAMRFRPTDLVGK